MTHKMKFKAGDRVRFTRDHLPKARQGDETTVRSLDEEGFPILEIDKPRDKFGWTAGYIEKVEESPWLHMDDAPMDGTEIDLFYPDRGRWTNARWIHFSWRKTEWRGNHTVEVVRPDLPSHWMHIPKDPQP